MDVITAKMLRRNPSEVYKSNDHDLATNETVFFKKKEECIANHSVFVRRAVPVTGKFYAAHDVFTSESLEQAQKVDTYQHNVTQSRAKGPHSKYPFPATENQVYGWYHEPLVHMDRNDRRFYNPQKESAHTKIEVIIRQCNPKSKKA